MKLRLALPLVLMLALGLMAGCQAAAPPQQPTPTGVPPTPAPALLEVVSLDGTTVSLTMEDIQALPVSEGWSGIMSSTGEIHVPEYFQAVGLADLATVVGGLPEATGMNVVAEDGYAITFSFEQILNGDFITYDPATGGEISLDTPVVAALAYARDGQPLDMDSEGALRLVVLSPANDRVVDGHWSVKWVNRIELMPLAAAWTVHLEGGTVEDLDRGSFESCAAASCHPSEWTDEDGQVWTGIPLWLLLGRADDDVQHGDGAFNEALAAQAYPIEVVASDGYAVTFDSSALARSDDVLIAHLLDGEPLPEDQAPLRLVGDGLTRGQRVGMIAQILLQIPEGAAPVSELAVPTPGVGESVALTVSGEVANELSVSLEGMRAMGPVTIEAEHPRRGMQTYEGIRLSTLLEAASVADGATSLVFVADDGYEVEIALADLAACADCLLAFNEDGGLDAAMPGFASNQWGKGLVTLRIE